MARILILTTLVVAASGCYVRGNCPAASATFYQDPAYVQVATAPPPMTVEVETQPLKPTADAVWVGGHFAWRGSWVWEAGRWETPRPGYAWTAPVVVQAGGGYHYHPGYWRPARVEPAPVYREPGRISVSVR